ncbi:hypothetical protein EYZ11_010432 [Aspergillus tanneri]|uniref:Uncharacterized protein n=1 Tax=Aspergillus tanneri TaxID=1220188 RepID=A0A4S3J7J2_9EURO|nr:hypothetical protein EYZ11_010432 [Aspergillus tanneri]
MKRREERYHRPDTPVRALRALILRNALDTSFLDLESFSEYLPSSWCFRAIPKVIVGYSANDYFLVRMASRFFAIV